MPITCSVLMSVYSRVSSTELSQSLRSIDWQTRAPDQIVIVIDGPVSNDIRSQLDSFKANNKVPVELVVIEHNLGLTAALNEGLKHCSGEWLIRMDADDLSLPTRFEMQLGYLEAHPEIDLLGTALLEFGDDPNRPTKIKPVKSDHDAMAGSMGLRNPINHPTVCVRKQSIVDVGGYPELPLLEDYFLWSKLVLNGARLHNLETPLYLFRFDDNTLTRRGGGENFKNEIWLRRWMRERGLITFPAYCTAVSLQLVLRFSPLFFQRWLWHRSRTATTQHLDLPS